jgi:CelD/BcsL family acetyltransferase involved in cellulose biosynthesis
VTVVHIDPTTSERWAALVKAHDGSLFHSPPWIAAIASTYDLDLRAAVLLDDSSGVPRAGVAYAMLDDDLGRRIVTLPFTDACDPLTTSDAEWIALADVTTALDAPWSLRLLDGGPASADSRFRETDRARWHQLGVCGPAEELWAGTAGAFRRGVRKARTEGVEVRPLREADDVEAIVSLHQRLRRTKYAMLAQPTSLFATLRDRFAPLDGWHPLGAFHRDRLVAMTVYLQWGDTLYYKFNASDPSALGARPNNILLWEGVELARSLGCHTLDLGRSDDDQPGLIRFKTQSGATERELSVRTWTPPGMQPSASVARLRTTLADLTALFVAPTVDERVTRAASDALYRWFS